MTSTPPKLLHLVSDATGDTLQKVTRACLTQFDIRDVEEYDWPFVRSAEDIQQLCTEMTHKPGLVLYTMVSDVLALELEKQCASINMPCIPVLQPVVHGLAQYLDVKQRSPMPGRQYKVDAEYFERMDALDFAIAHDDGKRMHTLHEADVVLVGISRCSKTPTSVYLGYRGVKAANIPLVPYIDPPQALLNLKGPDAPLVIGLVAEPAILSKIRHARLDHLTNNDMPIEYDDLHTVRHEMKEARQLYKANGWPVLDISHRSVEETAAHIMQMLRKTT